MEFLEDKWKILPYHPDREWISPVNSLEAIFMWQYLQECETLSAFEGLPESAVCPSPCRAFTGPRYVFWGRCAVQSHCHFFQTTSLLLTVPTAINGSSSRFVLLNTRFPSFPLCCWNTELWCSYFFFFLSFSFLFSSLFCYYLITYCPLLSGGSSRGQMWFGAPQVH